METGPLLEEAYVTTGKVVYYFRHFPLSFHPYAMPAAKASYCAGQQKPALFWAMHDWLFANQEKWSQAQDGEKQFRDQALALGADAAKYDACVAAKETEARIQKDLADGQKMGVQGTPAFFVNDWFISGAVPLDQFKSTIEQALAGKHPPPTPTPLPAGVQPYDANPDRPGFTYDGTPLLGDAKATLVLIAFDDLKCQSCAQFAKDVEPVLNDKYVKTAKLRIVEKFYPTEAPQAAVASLCAADQGKFWDYRDALFAHQSEWKDDDKAALTKYAKDLGLDEAKFGQCLAAAPGQTHLEENVSLGQDLGVDRLPYFLLLNPGAQTGTRLPGAVPLADMEKAIEQFLNPQPTPASQPLGTATPAK